MKKTTLRALIIAFVIGVACTAVSSLFLPTYQNYSINDGYTVLTGLEAIKYTTQQNGFGMVVVWLTGYFVSFFLPVFSGCMWFGLWNRKT